MKSKFISVGALVAVVLGATGLVAMAAACGSSSGDAGDLADSAGGPTSDQSAPDGTTTTSPDAGPPADGALADAPDPDSGDASPSGPRTAGLVLWLDPTKKVTKASNGEVTAWADTSAANTPTTLLMMQQNFEPLGIGSHPAVRTGGLNASVILNARPFTLLLVGRADVQGVDGQIFGVGLPAGFVSLTKQASDALQLRRVSTTTLITYSSVPAVSSKAQIYGLRRKDATSEIRIDGTATAVVDPLGGYNASGATILLLYFGQRFFAGDILLYDAELSDADVGSVEAFLKKKYDL